MDRIAPIDGWAGAWARDWGLAGVGGGVALAQSGLELAQELRGGSVG